MYKAPNMDVYEKYMLVYECKMVRNESIWKVYEALWWYMKSIWKAHEKYMSLMMVYETIW